MCEIQSIGFNNEMKRLIRSIIEVTIEEGYDISDVNDAISLGFKESTVKKEDIEELTFEEMSMLDVEKKLTEMFNEAWPDSSCITVNRMVKLCSTYIVAKQQGKNMDMGELALVASKRINLKVSTLKVQIPRMTSQIAEKFYNKEKQWFCRRVSSKECLEELYKEYFQEERANGYV